MHLFYVKLSVKKLQFMTNCQPKKMSLARLLCIIVVANQMQEK